MKNRNIIVLMLILALAVFTTVAQSTQQFQTPYDDTISPVDTLASYYNAIENHDYLRAYNYWQSAPRTYADFVNGFADTVSIQLIVEPPTFIGIAAGSSYVEIPTVLIAEHTDGTVHTYAGCFVTRKSNLEPPAIPEEDTWHLYSANILEVANSSSIPALLANGCQPNG